MVEEGRARGRGRGRGSDDALRSREESRKGDHIFLGQNAVWGSGGRGGALTFSMVSRSSTLGYYLHGVVSLLCVAHRWGKRQGGLVSRKSKQESMSRNGRLWENGLVLQIASPTALDRLFGFRVSTTITSSSSARRSAAEQARHFASTFAMGAMLSSFRRGGPRAALHSVLTTCRSTAAALLGSFPAAAARFAPFSSDTSTSTTTTTTTTSRWLEEELQCPCRFTDNFFIKRVSRQWRTHMHAGTTHAHHTLTCSPWTTSRPPLIFLI